MKLEYTLLILDPLSGMKWEIAYRELNPTSNERTDLQRKDPRIVIGSNKEGVVVQLDQDAGVVWRTALKSPTTAVFDIYMSTRTKGISLARQPKELGQRSFDAHIGIYENQLYVLSQSNYPLLQKDDLSSGLLPRLTIGGSGEDGDEDESGDDTTDDKCKPGTSQYQRCLVGKYTIVRQLPPGGQPTLDAPIFEGPTDDLFPKERKISTMTTLVGWAVILVGILTVIVYAKGTQYLTKPVDTFLEEHSVPFRVDTLARAVKNGVMAMNSAAYAAGSALGINSGHGASGRASQDVLPEYNDKSTFDLTRASIKGHADGLVIQDRALDEKSDKGGKKGPRNNKATDQDGADSKTKEANGGGGGGRKKKRGGGGKKAAAAAAAAAAATTESEGATAADGATPEAHAIKSTIADVEKLDGSNSRPLSTSTAGSATAVESSQELSPNGLIDLTRSPRVTSTPLLKSISVTDTILGYGSHGTVVYRGQYDGRAVAVKRLLIDFYDVAFHEVRLLQESDDHPNVVRYFRSVSYEAFGCAKYLRQYYFILGTNPHMTL